MAVKGTVEKQIVFDKLLEVFPGSFMYNSNKECRININGADGLVQLKVTLTAAKEPVANDNNTIVSEVQSSSNEGFDFPNPVGEINEVTSVSKEPIRVTEQEKEDIKNMMKALGL